MIIDENLLIVERSSDVKGDAFSCTSIQVHLGNGVMRAHLNGFGTIGHLSEPTTNWSTKLLLLLKGESDFESADL